jgi:hypothetical protein
MAGKQAQWRYSVVSGGRQHAIDAEVEGGILKPKAPNDLMPEPLKLADPIPVEKDKVAGLPDRTVVAEKAGSDVIFYFQPQTQPQRRDIVRPSIPLDEIDAPAPMNDVESHVLFQIREMIVQESWDKGAAERTQTFEALTKESRREVLEGIRNLPTREDEEVMQMKLIIDNLARGDRNPIASAFLKELQGATAEAMKKHHTR